MEGVAEAEWHLCKSGESKGGEASHLEKENPTHLDEQLPSYRPLSLISNASHPASDTLSISSQTAAFGSGPPSYRSPSTHSVSPASSTRRRRDSSSSVLSRSSSLSSEAFTARRSAAPWTQRRLIVDGSPFRQRNSDDAEGESVLNTEEGGSRLRRAATTAMPAIRRRIKDKPLSYVASVRRARGVREQGKTAADERLRFPLQWS